MGYMRCRQRTMWIAFAVVIAAALAGSACAETFRDEAMIKCVEGGGIFYDDGHCEGGEAGEAPPTKEPGAEKAEPDAERSDPGVQYGDKEPGQAAADGDEAARKECRKKGGRYRSDGTCEIRQDPVARCQDAGGLFMVDGRCFRPSY
jgi:hypothetical protein